MTGDVNKRIVWLSDAKNELKKIILFVKRDSPQNAAAVKKEILEIVNDFLNLFQIKLAFYRRQIDIIGSYYQDICLWILEYCTGYISKTKRI